MLLVLAAWAGTAVIATAAPNPVFSKAEKHDWATFPATMSGKAVTVTLSCKASGKCDMLVGQKQVGTASFKIGDEVEATLVFTPDWMLDDAELQDLVKVKWAPTTTQLQSLRSVLR